MGYFIDIFYPAWDMLQALSWAWQHGDITQYAHWL